ncbi:neuroligin-4, X-linked-like [Schistocerca nitens]|uniref:neuroligin-4, X-linked-like n=1 Tax=Schistocerca nitens TaxID=7011 RepID=UPI002118303B|nr:neuroligin-4, X-linked-like [Schistocerca nitens]
MAYSTRVVRTKYGPVRGLVLQQTVEAFLGVPYASPPVGALRYMPPLTPSPWRHTRLADALSPVCPQRTPDISNRSDALLRFPRGRLRQLELLLPLLANQSEDCLYLNLYVPRADFGWTLTSPPTPGIASGTEVLHIAVDNCHLMSTWRITWSEPLTATGPHNQP